MRSIRLAIALICLVAIGTSMGCSGEEPRDASDARGGDATSSDTGTSQIDDTRSSDVADADIPGDANDDAEDIEPNTDAADDTASDGMDDADADAVDDLPWVTAYLASWKHYQEPSGNWGNLRTEDIDWDAFTHLNYFAMRVNSDGSLSQIAPQENINRDRLEAIVDAAHQHDVPVLISFGGWGNHDGFAAAIGPDNRATFIQNIVDMLDTWGFDGVDLDMEPIRDEDVDDYRAFVTDLHAALQGETTPLRSTPLLTTATDWQPEMHADLADLFDQINLMTYDFSGAWPGWVAWHNSPIYDGGETFPSTGEPLPSIDESVQTFLDAGVPAEKLGIGIDFYGYEWTGVSEPMDGWSDQPPSVETLAFHDIVANYDIGTHRHWDADAAAVYLSVDGDPPTFVSYDDERTVEEKLRYVREQGLGGAIIWEIGGGYLPSSASGERDPLLQAVKQHRR